MKSRKTVFAGFKKSLAGFQQTGPSLLNPKKHKSIQCFVPKKKKKFPSLEKKFSIPFIIIFFFQHEDLTGSTILQHVRPKSTGTYVVIIAVSNGNLGLSKRGSSILGKKTTKGKRKRERLVQKVRQQGLGCPDWEKNKKIGCRICNRWMCNIIAVTLNYN